MIRTTITTVDASAIDIALTEPFAIAKGAPDIAANVLVKVILADGTIGLGEAAPLTAVSGETQERSLRAVTSISSWLTGCDVRHYRVIAARLRATIESEPAARCAVEMAVFDALTRQLGIPLWEYFGGRGNYLDTDMTITAGDAEHAAAAARAVIARGIETIKVKIGALSAKEDAERIGAVQQAAPRSRLIADANGGYTPDEAMRFLRLLEASGISLALFEQPVEPDRWLEFRRASRAFRVPLCADESARTAADVIRLVRDDAIDAVNIKPMKSGVVEAVAMWQVATAAGVDRMIGGMIESPLAMSFSVHLAAGLGGFAYVDLDTPMFMADHPFVGGFDQERGRLSVARVEAGHGVHLRAPPSFGRRRPAR
jgi:L-alanine-DL-glutamate epimerase-like enolase superfamily enzyme